MGSTVVFDKCQATVKEADMASIVVPSANSEEAEFEGFVGFCEGRSGGRFSDPQAFYSFSVDRYRDFWRLFLEWVDPVREGTPLACGARVVLYDGPLAETGTLWQIVAEEQVTVFGTSPPYLQLNIQGVGMVAGEAGRVVAAGIDRQLGG